MIIDVIVTGDSHYLYGNDELRGLKLPVIYEYPLEFKNPNGEPVFVMEGWAYSAVVGDLGVKFSLKVLRLLLVKFLMC